MRFHVECRRDQILPRCRALDHQLSSPSTPDGLQSEGKLNKLSVERVFSIVYKTVPES